MVGVDMSALGMLFGLREAEGLSKGYQDQKNKEALMEITRQGQNNALLEKLLGLDMQDKWRSNEHPTPGATAAELDRLGPDSLERLLMYQGKKTPGEIQSSIGEANSKAELNKAGIGKVRSEINKNNSEDPAIKGNVPYEQGGIGEHEGSYDSGVFSSLPFKTQTRLQPGQGETPEEYQNRIGSAWESAYQSGNKDAIAVFRHLQRTYPEYFEGKGASNKKDSWFHW